MTREKRLDLLDEALAKKHPSNSLVMGAYLVAIHDALEEIVDLLQEVVVRV